MLLLALTFLGVGQLAAQEKEKEVDHSYKPLTLKLNEDGSKYLRFIMWHQIWATTNSNLGAAGSDFELSTSIRRSRFLAYAQISPRFLVLTHWGLNSLNIGNLTISGVQGNAPQLFLHDAWTEFKVSDELYIGGGLHYWKGMNRLANSSTLNFMTLDATTPFVGWHSLGYSDQFARHLGIYAKGDIGKFDYRIAFNSPLINNIDVGRIASTAIGGGVYAGPALAKNGDDTDGIANADISNVVEGYFRYNFWDKESNKLPYAVGTYLGKKKIFNVGAGFFLHPNAIAVRETDPTVTNPLGTFSTANVSHFAVDAFLDLPVGDQGDAVTAYATYMNFNYGDVENYINARAGTGSAAYIHAGYYINAAKLQPYAALQLRNYNNPAFSGNSLDVGVNYFVNGHHAKLTLEYHTVTNDNNLDVNQLRLQAHMFL